MIMKRHIVNKLALIALSLPMLAGCVVYQQPPPPGPVVVDQAPPPPVAEVVPVAPGPLDVWIWIPGGWEWRGRWVWVGGRWGARPHPGAVWVASGWGWHGHRRVWVHGYWR